MRLLLSLVILFGVGQQSWADKNLDKVDKLSSALSDSVKSKSLYLSLLNSSKALDKGKIQESIYVLGVLGARLHKDLGNYKIYTSKLKKNYPKSILASELSLKNLSDACKKCDGSKTSERNCSKCKGTGKCKNVKCVDGQYDGFEYIDGKFTSVKKDCSTCSASGICNGCEAGKRMAKCTPCRGKGYKYNARIALAKYEGMITTLVADIQTVKVESEKQGKLAKGLVEVDGAWYTKDELELKRKKEELARDFAEKDAELARKLAAVKSLEEEGLNLLAAVEATTADKSEQFIVEIEVYLKKNPYFSKIEKLRSSLSYCRLIRDGQKYEVKGSVDDAIVTYKKALQIKGDQQLSRKLKKLGKRSIGL
ncbi:MAG: hypothetical protein NE334_05555 [Lentisphaeraceae bacterium]|nr:hypothetical protein [Lentisphaeraceae bacterium]